MTLTELLQKYPWSHEIYYNASDAPLDTFWSIDLEVSREKIWPLLIDTSTTNKMLNLPQMSYVEKDGALYGRAKYIGILSTWREEPWQWIYLQEMEMRRIYSRGFAKFVRTYIFLEEIDAYRCRIYFYFGWLPRKKLDRFLLKKSMVQLEKNYRKTMTEFSEIIHIEENTEKQRIALFSKINKFSLTETQNNKITDLKKKLLDEDIDLPLAEKLINYIRTASEEEISRFRVKSLAYLWQVDKKELLKIFLYGTRYGLFVLSWDIICPHCRGMRESLLHLGEIPQKSSCQVCEIDFDTQEVETIEVIFHMHPSIIDIKPKQFCAAEPAKKPHIFVQQTVLVNERKRFAVHLPAGDYNIRKLNEKNIIILRVASDQTLGKISLNFDSEQDLTCGNLLELDYHNAGSVITQLTIESRIPDDIALRPSEIFGLQTFRDLFSEEALASGLKLNIGNQAILFTDIIGSTNLYKDHGDDYAFMMVKKHFTEIFSTISNYNGVVVKTIGDAVMAAFEDPSQAMLAAIELQKRFSGEDDQLPLKIRVSLNYGKVLAVNLNSNIDYFGQTVNLAAKFQNVVGAGEISFNGNLLEDNEVKKSLRQNQINTLTRCETKSDYFAEDLKLFKIRIAN